MALGQLTVLVVDDEHPALSELAFLLGEDPRIGEVLTAQSGTDALGVLDRRDVDVVFSDISMPGLDGMALARVLAKFSNQPQIVFVTAHDQHAVDAFALAATDYVMKPVRADRLAEAVRRVLARTDDVPGAGAPEPATNESGRDGLSSPASLSHSPTPSTNSPADSASAASANRDETIPVELGGVTRFISRSQIRYAQAQGDYARLHTAHGSHLVRIPLSVLEEQWAAYGFVRIHRSTLVALPHVTEVRIDHGRCTVVIDSTVLQVSRRHTKDLRDVLLRRPLGRQ